MSTLEERYIEDKGLHCETLEKHYSVGYVIWLEHMVVELENRLNRLINFAESRKE